MCGINGITWRDRALVEQMNTATKHRGPDGSGIYENDYVTLGHNRLAIIDVSDRGAQPMSNADESLFITYNGELYNYRELREELSTYPFKSGTDTEVILAAYERWGISCLKRFNGIFAFALWDGRNKELVLARDHLGIKPLYYAVRDKAIVFSSEIKAMLATGISRELNVDAFSCFMRIAAAPEPLSFFRAVQKLPAGHYAVFKDGVLTIETYWRSETISTASHSAAEWRIQIRDTLAAAVERQLISDRPVGVFLSGGIDSSAILANVAHVAAGLPRTYTVRFEVDSPDEEEKFNSDAVLAARTAKMFGAQHTEITLKRADTIRLFEEATWHMDMPSRSATALAQLALARAAARDVAVVLGGDGGDELFGGYERYRLSRIMDIYQRTPHVLRNLLSMHTTLKKLNTPPGMPRFTQFYFLKQPVLNRVLADSYRIDTATPLFAHFFERPDTPFLDALLNADLHVLSDSSLVRTDKLSMAAGLEARVPMLDREMVELAARIPATQKVSLFSTKHLFKEAVREQLPSYLFQQPKRGWFAPLGHWLQKPDMHGYIQEVLSPSYYPPTAELFNWSGITSVLDAHVRGIKTERALLLAVLSFQVWARTFQVRP